MSYVQTVKVLILGNSGVGKTNIMERYTTGQFYDNWITTVGIDFRSKMLTITEKQVKLQIWDTAGQERYRTIVASYYRGAHAIILVYDVTDKSSFDDVKNWLEQIHLNADHGIEILIVGNKVDLEDKRTVSYEQGKKFADDNSLKFFEVSAKSGVHVDDVFFTTATDVLNSDHFQKRQQQTNTVNMNKKSSSSSSGCCGGGGSK